MTPIVSELFLRTQSDERLVSLARTGHNQAFVAIVSRYQRELLVFARRSGPEGRAEDVVQQALLNAFVALRGGTEVVHLRGWLYTIVRRGLAKAAAGEPLAEGGAAGAATTESLEEVVLRRARARDTLAAVRELPSRQRTALIATALQGERRSDVARTLGQSEGAVRQLVHRARRNLREAVGALIPYPLARWVLPLRGGSRASASIADVAGSPAMGSTAGLVAKVGAVLASGALLTGIAAPHPSGAVRHHFLVGPAARASVPGPRVPVLASVSVVKAARGSGAPAPVRVVLTKLRAAHSSSALAVRSPPRPGQGTIAASRSGEDGQAAGGERSVGHGDSGSGGSGVDGSGGRGSGDRGSGDGGGSARAAAVVVGGQGSSGGGGGASDSRGGGTSGAGGSPDGGSSGG
jgi:RNA polymerase sigma factor (sigma-70 family)